MAKYSSKNCVKNRSSVSRFTYQLFLLLVTLVIVISLLSALLIHPASASSSSSTHQHKKARGSNYAIASGTNTDSSDTRLQMEVKNQQEDGGFELAAESDIETPPTAECSIEVRQVVKYAGKCVRFKGGIVSGCESFVGGYVEPFNHECMSSSSGK